MKQTTKKQKVLFLSLIATAVVVLVSIPATIFLIEKSASEKTYPLGNQLEYIGKDGYGCWLFCDSNPNAIYYYATDMRIEQVIAYFKNTSIEQSPRTLNGETDFSLNTKDGKDISIYYYADTSKIIENKLLKKTKRHHIISVPSFDYAIAQKAL